MVRFRQRGCCQASTSRLFMAPLSCKENSHEPSRPEKAIAGKRFRITADGSAEARNKDPWMLQMPCQFGTILPHGPDRLSVEVDNHRYISAKPCPSLPGLVDTHQDGQHEKTFVFPVEMFRQVADIVRPRKRRQMTPEQREAASERLAAWKFSAHQGGENDLESIQGDPDE